MLSSSFRDKHFRPATLTAWPSPSPCRGQWNVQWCNSLLSAGIARTYVRCCSWTNLQEIFTKVHCVRSTLGRITRKRCAYTLHLTPLWCTFAPSSKIAAESSRFRQWFSTVQSQGTTQTTPCAGSWSTLVASEWPPYRRMSSYSLVLSVSVEECSMGLGWSSS